jgi:hypothetical protein
MVARRFVLALAFLVAPLGAQDALNWQYETGG